MSFSPTSFTFTWILLISCVFSSMKTTAQSADSKIAQLNEGTLVVVLQTEQKKQKLLKDITTNESKSPAERKRAKKLLEASKSERQAFNHALAQAFEQSYDFSDYVIIEDVDFHEFSKGGTVTFYDANLKASKNQKFKGNKPVFYVKEGYADGSGSYSFNIVDEHLENMSSYFPSSVRVNGSIFDDLANIFSKKNDFYFVNRIKKLNKKLLKAFGS